MFIMFITRVERCKLNQGKSVEINDLPVVEDLLRLRFFQFGIDIVDRNMIHYENHVRLLRHNIHKCHVTVFNAAFRAFRFP